MKLTSRVLPLVTPIEYTMVLNEKEFALIYLATGVYSFKNAAERGITKETIMQFRRDMENDPNFTKAF